MTVLKTVIVRLPVKDEFRVLIKQGARRPVETHHLAGSAGETVTLQRYAKEVELMRSIIDGPNGASEVLAAYAGETRRRGARTSRIRRDRPAVSGTGQR